MGTLVFEATDVEEAAILLLVQKLQSKLSDRIAGKDDLTHMEMPLLASLVDTITEWLLPDGNFPRFVAHYDSADCEKWEEWIVGNLRGLLTAFERMHILSQDELREYRRIGVREEPPFSMMTEEQLRSYESGNLDEEIREYQAEITARIAEGTLIAR